MSTWGIDFYDNPNKQRVREELWLPYFIELIAEINSREKNKRSFRYLCLPGQECLFLRELLEGKHFDKKTYVVGIESERIYEPKIKKFLMANFNSGNTHLHIGRFQKLSGTDNRFKKRFPFDIANIDITGSFQSSSDKGISYYFEGLNDFLLNQAYRIKEKPFLIDKFYIIITSNLKGWFSDELKIKFHNNIPILLKEIVLKDYLENFELLELETLIKKKSFDNEEECKISITALILRLLYLCSQYFKSKVISVPYCYSGHIGGAKMVSLVVMCKSFKQRLGANGSKYKYRKICLKEGYKTSQSIKFLPESES